MPVWRNGVRELPCPGTYDSSDGFAVVMNAPAMEDGRTRGIGLLTHPQKVNNGQITGKYAAIDIQTGDHFSALIGCLNKANDCNMIFKLEYQIGSDPVKALGQWHEIYEGEYYPIDIDLSFLNGKKVKFILTILANGSSHEDYGLWVAPRITRQSDKLPPRQRPARHSLRQRHPHHHPNRHSTLTPTHADRHTHGNTDRNADRNTPHQALRGMAAPVLLHSALQYNEIGNVCPGHRSPTPYTMTIT
jgi:hypothetical protein